ASDPLQRADLLMPLGREAIRGDQPRKAALYYGEYVAAHRDDCAARDDYGLALAWSDRLAEAHEQYQRVIAGCDGLRNTARLRDALVSRWMDRPSRAESLYRAVLGNATADEKRDAQIGLGYVALQREQNRAALQTFEQFGETDGIAVAAYRLGLTRDVHRVMALATRPSRDLTDIEHRLRTDDDFEVRPEALAFHDADGTNFRSAGVRLSRGWQNRARGELALGDSDLRDNRSSLPATLLEVAAEERFSPALAIRSFVRRTGYRDWQPLSGEAHLVITPSDPSRIDVSFARPIVTDNVAAVRNRLAGNYVSIGADRRVTALNTATMGLDLTRWNDGNTRRRITINWRHAGEGLPRVRWEWPTMWLSYDRPFTFALFSPRRYIETGPAISVDRRFARVWTATAYIRAGAHNEEHIGWRPLTVLRAAIDRELTDRWSLRAEASWSNSNVTSTSGFRRTAIGLQVARRF
ncbi:MAG TPA: hypothetical protein VLU46_02775, partial [Thermoanaerobaculia bacterium]|nr:hypothetical protein [Thermoanaerobaculia bacterium]